VDPTTQLQLLQPLVPLPLISRGDLDPFHVHVYYQLILHPELGVCLRVGRLWFSALNDDEASQCLLSTLNSQNWAGGPHCEGAGNDAAAHTALWDWNDCLSNGGDNNGLSLT